MPILRVYEKNLRKCAVVNAFHARTNQCNLEYIFSIAMLATLALEYPTLKIFAYIDDINLRKHKTIFRRLRRMGANNVSYLILSKCVNVRQRYQIRTHAPEASGEMAKEFDSEVEDVLKAWLGPLTSDQVEWARFAAVDGWFGPVFNGLYPSGRI